MSATSASGVFPTTLPLLGGVPVKHPDFAASIVFIVAYALLLPLALWRIASPASRCITLIRPVIFIVVRIGTFIVRVVQSEGHYSKGLFIAELICLLCGFVLLCEPLVSLLDSHITRYTPIGQPKGLLSRLTRLLTLALIIAAALGVYTGTKLGDSNANTNQLKITRDANVIICLCITVLVAIITIGATVRRRLPWGPALLLLLASALLTIVSVYKLVIYIRKPAPSLTSTGSKIAFYLFVSVPEYLTTALFLGFNVNVLFDVAVSRRKKTAERGYKMNGEIADGHGSYAMMLSGSSRPPQNVHHDVEYAAVSQ